MHVLLIKYDISNTQVFAMWTLKIFSFVLSAVLLEKRVVPLQQQDSTQKPSSLYYRCATYLAIWKVES